ncbi:MGMT family protein [Blastococcus sp. SYSU DS0619]
MNPGVDRNGRRQLQGAVDEGSEGEIVNEVAERVLRTVSSIPSGHVMTYGDVAEAAGTGARAVGQILRKGGHDVPWWRVVDALGRPVRGAAHEALAQFLEESTPLLHRGDDVRVDLAHASWSSHEVGRTGRRGGSRAGR